jgi:hypothetical protein
MKIVTINAQRNGEPFKVKYLISLAEDRNGTTDANDVQLCQPSIILCDRETTWFERAVFCMTSGGKFEIKLPTDEPESIAIGSLQIEVVDVPGDEETVLIVNASVLDDHVFEAAQYIERRVDLAWLCGASNLVRLVRKNKLRSATAFDDEFKVVGVDHVDDMALEASWDGKIGFTASLADTSVKIESWMFHPIEVAEAMINGTGTVFLAHDKTAAAGIEAEYAERFAESWRESDMRYLSSNTAL